MQRSKYRILGLVGQGQYGKVYCASDRQKGQLVALKELSHSATSTSQFLQELWYIISLQHPNIAACLGLEHIQNGRYLVMDYCEAGTLRGLIEGNQTLGLLEGLQIIVEILQGLDYAHQRGIIHCDIKPENILLTIVAGKWQPKLSDFGIARRLPSHHDIGSPSHAPGGSPAYMAPERFYGMYSAQSDIYAMGVVLYELLVGDRPFHGLFNELMWAHMNHRVERPTFLPECLQNILQTSLEKLPARRFPSASAMTESLKAAMADPSVQEIGDRLIPWYSPSQITTTGEATDSLDQDSNAIDSLEFYDLPHKLNHPPAPASKTLLASNPTHLYSATGSNVITWSYTETQPQSFTLSESVVSLYPMSHGCYILTNNYLHWWHNSSPQPESQSLEFLQNIFKGTDTTVKPTTLTISQDVVKSNLINSSRQADLLPECQRDYLTIALPGQLRFYSLTKELTNPNHSTDHQGHSSIKLLKVISVSTQILPQLTFIDGRHLLATWSNTKSSSPKTIFQMYSRRGARMGNIKLPINVNQVFATPHPYTILALCQHEPLTLLQINLKPLSVIRVSITSPPTALFMADWGYGWTIEPGKVQIFNWSGHRLVEYNCPVATALAPWKQTGLALVTSTAESIKVVDSLNLPVQELSEDI
ncbi:MAG: serine/threonine protein kinase [Arthrospira sp. PLM2.Bin9]|nr:serine/threonine-protein kinase [Arthrospira sp. PLM2.Bin9]TVU55332.1 MAG: serine/threonine protein kinase [Arthrospira sp. PLM2.Bin9]